MREPEWMLATDVNQRRDDQTFTIYNHHLLRESLTSDYTLLK